MKECDNRKIPLNKYKFGLFNAQTLIRCARFESLLTLPSVTQSRYEHTKERTNWRGDKINWTNRRFLQSDRLFFDYKMNQRINWTFFFRVNRNTQSMTTSWVGEKHKNNVIDGNLILTEAETTSDDICSIPFVNRFILPSILLIFWILSHWIQTVTKSKNKNQKMHFVKLSSAVDRWALMNRIL